MMKKFGLGIFLCLGLLLFLPLFVHAEDGSAYTVSEAEGGYLLTDGEGGTLLSAPTLQEIVDFLPREERAEVYFSSVSLAEDLLLEGRRLTLSGEVRAVGGARLILSGEGETELSGFTLSFSSCGIRLKEGTLLFTSGRLEGDGCAVLSDHASDAHFLQRGGEILSHAGETAVKNTLGSVTVSGGSIVSETGCAVFSEGTLRLGGTAYLFGQGTDVRATLPLTLTAEQKPFLSPLTLTVLSTFEKGEETPVAYGATEGIEERIHLLDCDGVRMPVVFCKRGKAPDERDYLAVSLPYRYTFFLGSGVYATAERRKGEALSFPEEPSRTGYRFDGWYTDREGAVRVDPASPPAEDASLYASFSLLPPTFSISSLSFVYDGELHDLAFSSLSHPLMEEGSFSFTWYREGEVCPASASALKLKSVSEAGSYCCRIRFSHGGASVEVLTPPVTVEIEKRRISLPICKESEYNGREQTATLFDTADYTVSQNDGGCSVGRYPVRLSLRDPVNCCFAETGEGSALLYFEITRAENAFCTPPAIADYFESGSAAPFAVARFGEVRYLYAEEAEGTYSEIAPTVAGTYYLCATVEGGESYGALRSQPIPFTVRAVTLISLRVGTPPSKIEYTALETFSPDGLCVLGTYSDGVEREIPLSSLVFSYPDGATALHVKAPYLLIFCGEVSCRLSLSVLPARYRTEEITFSDLTVTYDGQWHTVSAVGEIPYGMDGSRPESVIEGGGQNVGRYTVTLRFINRSEDHLTPPDRTATLTVLPRESTLRFSETEFIYTGEAQCPTAFYTDISGHEVSVPVIGARIEAGEGYLATACPQDRNYSFSELSRAFRIRKATYDLSATVWSQGDFIYDGEEKSVTLSGLPSGVTVSGYADASAREAGCYTARVTLCYDTVNYEAPVLPPYTWQIGRAEYPVTYRFSDLGFVYDGQLHYPVLEGALPIGADGSVPTVSFDGGIRDVSEGVRAVTVSFRTESKNYLPPQTLSVRLHVLPRGVRAVFCGGEFTYTGQELCPTAYAEGESVFLLVSGGAVDAGEYTATATVVSENYTVLNPTFSYRILPAENLWLTEQMPTTIYESELFCGTALAKSGEVVYRFFSDQALENEIETPTSFGTYYVRAEVAGSRNYLPLLGAPVSLTLLRVLPVSLAVTARERRYVAFDLLSVADLSAVLTYNDGSVTAVDPSLLSVTYPRGDSLRAGEETVSFSYLGLSAKLLLGVEKRSISLAGAYLSTDEAVYDGGAHAVELLGLPQGFSVSSYENALYSHAGIYTVTAHLAFDRENYEAEESVTRTLRVLRLPISAPTVGQKIYNGTLQRAELPASPYYTVRENAGGVHAGSYPLVLSLTDPQNTVFADSGEETLSLSFVLLPRPLHYVLSDLLLYRGESLGTPHLTLAEGEILEGEDPFLYFTEEEGRFLLHAWNSDYAVTFEGGEILRSSRLSPDRLRPLLLLSLLGLALLLLGAWLLYRRRRRRLCLSLYRQTAFVPSPPPLEAPRPPVSPSETESPLRQEEEKNMPSSLSAQGESGLLSTTAEAADALITDALARELISEEERTVITRGTRHSIVNVDTLSDSFCAGERVDINRLKEKTLVASDAGYLKVLARGSIDKPLSVYADDFSLQAVKMIALTGGEAIRARTVEREEKK